MLPCRCNMENRIMTFQNMPDSPDFAVAPD